jgi:hypothetical protein
MMLLHGCLVVALVCSLGHGAVAWNHVTQQQLQDALDSSGYTLVACKYLERHVWWQLEGDLTILCAFMGPSVVLVSIVSPPLSSTCSKASMVLAN